MSFQSVATAHTLADQQQKVVIEEKKFRLSLIRNWQTIENEVNKITAGGGTSFSNIFDALTKSLTEYTTKRDKSVREKIFLYFKVDFVVFFLHIFFLEAWVQWDCDDLLHRWSGNT